MSAALPSVPAPALLALADHLEALAAERGRAARMVREGWVGPNRVRFDAERATRDADLAAIIARCRSLAGR